jgi:hypothetical protein
VFWRLTGQTLSRAQSKREESGTSSAVGHSTLRTYVPSSIFICSHCCLLNDDAVWQSCMWVSLLVFQWNVLPPPLESRKQSQSVGK